MKLILAVFLVLALCLSAPLSAEAALCRTVDGHTICILEVKRSAKNYWEYRAAIKVDNQEHPIELYNCRSRIRVRTDGTEVPFEANGAGDLICRTLHRA